MKSKRGFPCICWLFGVQTLLDDQASVKDFVVTMPGWSASKGQLIRNGGAGLKNVYLNTNRIASSSPHLQ
jgi:hypothetical protein